MFRWLLMAVFCSVSMFSCFDPPEYPNEPEIVFKSLNYVDVPDLPNGEVMADSLILVIRFKDGDGNLGLSPNEVHPPYNDRWYYLKSNLNQSEYPECAPWANENKCYFVVDPEDSLELAKYVDYVDKKSKVPPYDQLPDFKRPENCLNWEVLRDEKDQVVDTVYFTLNEHYSNIFVEFQTKTGNDTYAPFDWSTFLAYPSCEVQGFNGRFPLLSEAGSTPLEGEIRYSMPSPFFRVIFGARSVRLRVYIEDRELNKSNEILTTDVSFQ